MRLSIVPVDGVVVKDGVGFTGLVWIGTPAGIHALQWFDTNGWIEPDTPTPNEIIEVLPEWANNAVAAWAVANTPKPPEPPTAEQNKATASQKLYLTDWTTIPDVSDPTKSNPHLTNPDDFIAYRNQVRALAINPVAGEIVWPVVPQANWS